MIDLRSSGRRLGMVAAITATSACVAAASSSPTAGPGSSIIPPSQAATFFNAGCLESAPSFSGTGAALAPFGFTRNSQTGTYYNNSGNLSIRTMPGNCSIVIGLDQAPDKTLLEFGNALNAIAPENDASVEIDLRDVPGDITYLIARTAG